jgi:hypothetical protein
MKNNRHQYLANMDTQRNERDLLPVVWWVWYYVIPLSSCTMGLSNKMKNEYELSLLLILVFLIFEI